MKKKVCILTLYEIDYTVLYQFFTKTITIPAKNSMSLQDFFYQLCYIIRFLYIKTFNNNCNFDRLYILTKFLITSPIIPKPLYLGCLLIVYVFQIWDKSVVHMLVLKSCPQIKTEIDTRWTVCTQTSYAVHQLSYR